MPINSSDKPEEPALTDEIRLYIEKRVQLLTLTLSEQLSEIVAISFQKLIGLLLLAGGVFFIWFAFGFYLGELIGSIGLGFLIVSLPLLIAGYIFMNHKSASLTHRIQGAIISKSMKSVESSLQGLRKSEEEKKAE